MVLSMLPMQAFGRGHVTNAPQQNPTSRVSDENAPLRFDAVFPLDAFDGFLWPAFEGNITPGAMFLEFRLSGGNAGVNHADEVSFRPLRGDGNTYTDEDDRDEWTVGDADWVDLTVEGGAGPVAGRIPHLHTNGIGEGVVSAQRMLLPFEHTFTPALLSGNDGFVRAELNIVARHRAATLTVTLTELVGGQLVPRITLVDPINLLVAERPAGVEITADGMATLVTHAVLPRIDLLEASVNNMVGGVAATNPNTFVRLVAPRGYRWETGLMAGVGGIAFGSNDALDRPRGRAGFVPAPGTNFFAELNVATQRHELNIMIPAAEILRAGGPVNAVTPGRISLAGLTLMALPEVAGSEADVEIDVFVNRTITGVSNAHVAAQLRGNRPDGNDVLTPAVGATPAVYGYLINTAERFAWLDNPQQGQGDAPAWREESLTVATRGAQAIEVQVPEDIAEGSSGLLTADWLEGGNCPGWLNRRNYTIRLIETSANTLHSGVGTFEFHLVQSGVYFQAVQLRANIAADGLARAAVRGADSNEWRFNEVNDHADRNSSAPAVLNATFNDASVVLPALTTLDRRVYTMAPRPLPAATDMRHIDLRFRLSVEPGFVANNGTNNIDVRVVGPGVDTVVTIANVTDPVTIGGEGVVTIPREQIGLGFAHVNPVTVTETETGTFSVGDVITLVPRFVMNQQRVTLPGGIAAPEINVIQTPTISAGSGLQLEAVAGTFGRQWRVTRPSFDAPATITFNGITFVGSFMPEIEYHVGIVGAGVDETSLDGIPRNPIVAGPGEPWVPPIQIFNAVTPLEDIRFGGLGFSVPVLVVEGLPDFGPPTVPGVTDPGVGRAPIAPQTWGDGASVTTAITNSTISGAVRNIDIGMVVSLRVVAENLLGTEPGWLGVNQPITLSGQNAAGQPMTVVVTQGQPTATITVAGQSRTVDMAMEAQRLAVDGWTSTEGAVTVRTIDGAAFLPLRFILAVFEIPFRWDGDIAAVRIAH